jgi:hypothetical protein
MKPRIVVIAISVAVFALGAAIAQAAKINGKQCAGMVSEQVNPSTGKKTYACRTVDGTIASGDTVEDKAKKDPPATAAPPKKAPAPASAQ